MFHNLTCFATSCLVTYRALYISFGKRLTEQLAPACDRQWVLGWHCLAQCTASCVQLSEMSMCRPGGVVGRSTGCLSEGDLVWGAARGFPAWPGKLAGPAPATLDGKVWVRWFGGDRALTQVSMHSLKTLSEGLEAHHRARKKFRK
jgi:hypothetical protein